MKVIGIVGSPRKDGNTAYLLKEAIKALEGRAETEIIFLKDYDIKPCEGCRYCEESERCKIEDGMQELYLKIIESDALILTSPVYMGGVTSRMRAFMERTWYLRKGQLKDKIGTWIVVGRRKIGSAINEMDEYLERLGMVRVPGVLGYAFKKGDILKDEEAIREARKLGKELLRMMRL